MGNLNVRIFLKWKLLNILNNWPWNKLESAKTFQSLLLKIGNIKYPQCKHYYNVSRVLESMLFWIIFRQDLGRGYEKDLN